MREIDSTWAGMRICAECDCLNLGGGVVKHADPAVGTHLESSTRGAHALDGAKSERASIQASGGLSANPFLQSQLGLVKTSIEFCLC